jgi:hypothetical protein
MISRKNRKSQSGRHGRLKRRALVSVNGTGNRGTSVFTNASTSPSRRPDSARVVLDLFDYSLDRVSWSGAIDWGVSSTLLYQM